MFELTGHRALVTGAGQGQGVGIAKALAAQGASVAVNDLVPEKAEATRAAIAAAGGTAISAAFDVSSHDAVTAGIQAAAEVLGGPIDILVNNAGIPETMGAVPFRQIPVERWRPYVDLNMYGSMYCISAVLEPMIEAGWGRIVQISSGAGRTGLKIGVSLYGASKSGIEGFIRHLAVEVGGTGVTANTLALGLMTAPEKPQDSSVTAGIARGIPVGRLGTPEDVGSAVVFLSSPEAEWLTGQTINLNGGSTFN